MLEHLISVLAIVGVAITGIVALAGWILGRLSLAYLRRQPDFPHKEEMIWGAKWDWAVFGGAIAVLFLVLLLVVNFGFYPTSLLAAVGTTFFIGSPWVIHFYRWQNTGGVAWAQWVIDQFRRRPTDWEAYIACRERTAKSQLRPLPLGLVLMVIFGATGWYISRNFPTEHLARQIRAAVKSENVVRVLPISPYFQPFSKPVYGGAMFVFVRPETPRHEMRDILRTAREMMKEADLRMRWILLVYATEDKVGSQKWNKDRGRWSEEHWSWPEK